MNELPPLPQQELHTAQKLELIRCRTIVTSRNGTEGGSYGVGSSWRRAFELGTATVGIAPPTRRARDAGTLGAGNHGACARRAQEPHRPDVAGPKKCRRHRDCAERVTSDRTAMDSAI